MGSGALQPSAIASPLQTMKSGNTGDAAAHDAIDLLDRPAADDGDPSMHGDGQRLQQFVADRVGTHETRSRHQRRQGSIEIEKQRCFRQRKENRLGGR